MVQSVPPACLAPLCAAPEHQTLATHWESVSGVMKSVSLGATTC